MKQSKKKSNNFDDLDEQNQINHPAVSNISDRFFMDGL